MQGLRAIVVVMATLLLVGTGAGAGYYYGSGDAPPSPAAGSAPPAMPSFASRMTLSAEGTSCTTDFLSGAGSCTLPDGTVQTVSRSADGGALHIQTTTASGDGQCVVIDTKEFGFDTSAEGAELDAPTELVHVGTQSKRVNSWVIEVPNALKALTGDEGHISEFEYYEKDGAPWKAEYFVEGADEPTVIHLSESSDAVVPADCTDVATAHGRSLKSIGESFGEALGVGLAGMATKAVMTVACNVGPVTCVATATVILSIVLAATCCRRRVRRLRGSLGQMAAELDTRSVSAALHGLKALEMPDLDFDAIATGAAAAATAAAAAATTQLAQIEA